MKPWRIRRLATTSSTNDDAKAAAEAGEAEGLVIHALSQTAGRGRHGRAWHSPEGNLYCSVLLRPESARDFGFYSFVASLAIADTVCTFLPQAAVTLKWPNDVLVGGKKISGILLEAGEGWLVIGMGLNIRHHPEDAMYPATSLFEEHMRSKNGDIPLPSREGLGEGAFSNPGAGNNGGPPPLTPPSRGEEFRRAIFDVDHILQTLLDRLHYWLGILREQGFASIRTAWLEKAQKGPLSVHLPRGNVQGDFADIDGDGRLILRLADGNESAIATGDVFFGD